MAPKRRRAPLPAKKKVTKDETPSPALSLDVLVEIMRVLQRSRDWRSHRTFKNLLQACRDTYTIGLPIFYRDVIIGDFDQALCSIPDGSGCIDRYWPNLKTVPPALEAAARAGYVRSLVLSRLCGPEAINIMTKAMPSLEFLALRTGEQWEVALANLDRATNLLRLHIVSANVYNASTKSSANCVPIDAVTRITSLKSICLSTPDADRFSKDVELNKAWLTALERAAPNLDHIDFEGCGNSGASGILWADYPNLCKKMRHVGGDNWDNSYRGRTPLPALPNALSFGCLSPVYVNKPRGPAAARYRTFFRNMPNLRSISISGGCSRLILLALESCPRLEEVRSLRHSCFNLLPKERRKVRQLLEESKSIHSIRIGLMDDYDEDSENEDGEWGWPKEASEFWSSFEVVDISV